MVHGGRQTQCFLMSLLRDYTGYMLLLVCSAPLHRQKPPDLRSSLSLTHTWKVWLLWSSSHIPHVSLIQTSPTLCRWGPSHVATCLSGREGNRIWGFGLPNLTTSSGEAERQDFYFRYSGSATPNRLQALVLADQ